MPWESIGSVNTGDMPHEEDWILFCLGMAKSYIDFVCEDTPDDGKLEIMWHDHELGNYPSLGVWYELEEPCGYISACEEALEVFNESVSYLDLKHHFQKKKDELDETEDDESEENQDEDAYAEDLKLL